ncbi:ferredoxin [Microbacterium sp. NPDC077644]|uniref:ferredoxin n=1 Tax=Microbacterium sp. NPDC077644 TaxID=3155055 RepID=UPI00344CF3C6
MTAKILLDRSRCVGLGLCEAVSPDHFEVGDDGALILLREDVADDEIELMEEAVEACPTRALLLERLG